MKRTIISALLVIVSSTIAAAQESRLPTVHNGPMKPLVETLRTTGNFNTFLSLLETAGLKNLGLVEFLGGVRPNPIASDGKVNPAQEGPGGGPRYHTLFAPTDAAFAKLPKGTVEALMKDQRLLKSFLLDHMLPGKAMVKDMFEPVENSKKEFKTTQGFVLGFSCDGRHAGMHNPTINGKARVGKFQDVMASDYLIVIHEVDAVLVDPITDR